MKKNNFYPLLIFLSLLIFPFGFYSCNKAYVAPEVTGTWAIDTSRINWFAEWDMVRLSEYKAATDISLDKRLIESYQAVRKALRWPSIIKIIADNTFLFLNSTQEQVDFGTYKQDGSYIFLTFLSSSYPNGIVALSDGSQLELSIGPLYLIPLIEEIAPLTIEESKFLFEGIVPEGVELPFVSGTPVVNINTLGAVIPFKLSNRAN